MSSFLQGCQQYLWCAVDEDGDVIDMPVQSRRNQYRRRAILPEAPEKPGLGPTTADYGQAPQLRARRTVLPSVVHCTDGTRTTVPRSRINPTQ